jgi:HlyD family secretion protein
MEVDDPGISRQFIRKENKLMKKRRNIIIAVAAVIIVAAFFIIRSQAQKQTDATADYQTVEITRGELVAIVGSTGSVHANQSTYINWETSGRVGDIYVELDDMVVRDEILAEIDPNSLPQAVVMAKIDLINAQRALDDLINSDVVRAQAELALAQAQIALDDAKDNRGRQDYRRASDTTLEVLRSNLAMAEDEVDRTEQIYDRFDHLDESDPNRAYALNQYANAKAARDRAYYNLQYSLGMPDDTEVAKADAELALAEANFAEAQKEWDRVKDGPDSEDIEMAEARVAAAKATLDMAYLKAPFNGKITEINIKSGDQAAPSMSAFRLDDCSRLLVDVMLPEIDINRIQAGDEARLTFDAIQGKEYKGVVSEVGRVGMQVGGGVDFKVTLEVVDADEDIRPGMTAAVNIVVTKLEDVLIIPNRAIRNSNGDRIVYILKQGMLEPVSIEIGASSEIYSEITGGEISEGDIVVLNPPTDFFSAGQPPFGR